MTNREIDTTCTALALLALRGYTKAAYAAATAPYRRRYGHTQDQAATAAWGLAHWLICTNESTAARCRMATQWLAKMRAAKA